MKLRNVLLAAAASIAVSIPAYAADLPDYAQPATPDQRMGLAFSAIGEFLVGYRSVDSTDDPDDNSHITGAASGAVSIPFGEMFSVQFDGQAEVYGDESDDEAPLGAYAVGVHANVRDPGLGLIGVFGGLTDGVADDNEEGDVGYFVGAEGQFYWNDLTLYAQGGFANIDVDESSNEGFVDGWFVRGVGRYFFTDDLMLQGEVSYGETDHYIDGNDAGEFWTWGVKARGKWWQTPIYATAEYYGGDFDATTEGDDAQEHAFRIGFSFLTGTQSLKDNDRYGATLDSPMLPARAAAWEEPLD